jgi:adenylylsulfate reductase subunit A
LVDLVYKPVRTFLDNCELQHRIDINPNYIKPERHDVSPDEGHP